MLLFNVSIGIVPAREARHSTRADTACYLGDAARQSPLLPGGPVQSQPVVTNPYNGSAYDISEGQRLYNWYNCTGCHSQGGGGIGPPLIKTEWIYGGEPENLF